MNLIDRFRNWSTGMQMKRVAAEIQTSWLKSEAVYSSVDFPSMVRSGWRKNELIFACISKTARAFSQTQIKVRSKTTGKDLPDHPLKKLLSRPNPEMSEFDFYSSIVINTMLGGRALFEKERSRENGVIRLWPLRQDYIKMHMKNAVQIEKYTYQPAGVDRGADLKPESVLHFRAYDPLGLFSAWPPAAVAARVGDLDNDTTDLLKAFFQDGGMPLGVLKTVASLQDEDVTILRARWRERYGGWKNWLDPAILDRGSEYQRVGLTFTEMGFPNLDSRSEARICMVMDVPPILLGAKIGLDRSTYSNYSEARRAWWQDSLLPRAADMIDVLEQRLLPEFDDRDQIEMYWDFSNVAALQEEQDSRWARAISALGSGAVLVNEFRAMLGLVDIGEYGQVFLRNASMMPVSIEQSGAIDLTQLTPPEEEPEEEEPEEEEEGDEEQDDVEEETEEGPEEEASHHHSAPLHKSALTDERRAEIEEELASQLVVYFQNQQNRILQEVSHESTDNG